MDSLVFQLTFTHHVRETAPKGVSYWLLSGSAGDSAYASPAPQAINAMVSASASIRERHVHHTRCNPSLLQERVGRLASRRSSRNQARRRHLVEMRERPRRPARMRDHCVRALLPLPSKFTCLLSTTAYQKTTLTQAQEQRVSLSSGTARRRQRRALL
jgi:hypothetical protein